ncbi:MAG: hypothetical protein IKM53_06705, partial [Clostridia bacterium]|nr:hypothetical protein [Clostridia bacterium]
GVYTWANGDVYEGNYVNDVRNGKGVLTLASGEKYDGHFANDLKHGNGTLNFENGEVYSGGFVNGKLDTRLTDENGKFILNSDGSYAHGAMAVYTFSTGRIYTGFFEEGKIVAAEESTEASGENNSTTAEN